MALIFKLRNRIKDKVTEFLTWPTHTSVAVTREVLNNWVNNYEKKDYYNWVIELKESGDIIGNISVISMKEKIEGAELGYCMGTKWWGIRFKKCKKYFIFIIVCDKIKT